MSLLAEAEAAVKHELMTLLSDPSLDGPATLRLLLDQSLTVIDRHPLLRFAFADPGEPAPWMRALGVESMEVLTEGDGETAGQVLTLLAAKGLKLDIGPEVLAGLLRGLVLLPLSRKTIGEAVYEGVRTTLVDALTRGLP